MHILVLKFFSSPYILFVCKSVKRSRSFHGSSVEIRFRCFTTMSGLREVNMSAVWLLGWPTKSTKTCSSSLTIDNTSTMDYISIVLVSPVCRHVYVRILRVMMVMHNCSVYVCLFADHRIAGICQNLSFST